jgi:arylsulfatase A-like enzyme
VHGVVKHLDEPTEGGDFFTPAEMRELRELQWAALEYVDGVMARLFDLLPSGTWVVVTSDHGELFGEDDYFGHGPIQHPKVYEVPFVEGLVP